MPRLYSELTSNDRKIEVKKYLKERSKRCVCKTGEQFELGVVSGTIKKDQLELSYNAYSSDSSFNEKQKINYCMHCGRKLSKEKE